MIVLSKECSTGWYATDIKDVVAKMAPGARMAVLPKLFWLSPVVASGDPPQIWGEQLPGQQESVATDWPNKIQEDVEEHFARVSEMYLFVFFNLLLSVYSFSSVFTFSCGLYFSSLHRLTESHHQKNRFDSSRQC